MATMTDTTTDHFPRDSRCRVARPERIDIGDDVLERNDVIARREGRSVRSLDREDGFGAPFTFIGGVKYRPMRAYLEYRLSQIRNREAAA